MPENKMRKHYRDKFRRKFNIRAHELPEFNSAEEYEKYYREKLFEEKQKDEYIQQLVEAGLLPDEVDLASDKLKRLYYKYAGIDESQNSLYNGLEKMLRKFKRSDVSLRKRLLRNATPEVIEAIETIVAIIPSDPDAYFFNNEEERKAESAILVLQKILSGGEIMSMSEAMEFFSNKQNFETN